MNRKTIIRAVTFTTGVAFGLNLMVGAGFAAPATTTAPTNPSSAKYTCNTFHNSDTGHGANNSDGYQTTCDSTDFGGNGQEFGPGLQTGKPCSGCVGNADNKNPPGQFKDGSDLNSGYECDGRDRPSVGQQGNGNQGIGDGNPAHTSCTPSTGTPPPPPVVQHCSDGTVMIDVDHNGIINEADCNKVDEDVTPPEPQHCADGTEMSDVDGNGIINEADCNKVDDEDVTPPEPQHCADGTDMSDVDHNGIINEADCNKVDDVNKVDDENKDITPSPAPIVQPEVVVTAVQPETLSPAVVPAVVATEVEGVTIEAAPVAPVAEVATDHLSDVAPTVQGRPTQVLGVQIERAASPLARTGVDTDWLAMLAGLLLALGAFLVRVGRRPVNA